MHVVSWVAQWLAAYSASMQSMLRQIRMVGLPTQVCNLDMLVGKVVSGGPAGNGHNTGLATGGVRSVATPALTH